MRHKTGAQVESKFPLIGSGETVQFCAKSLLLLQYNYMYVERIARNPPYFQVFRSRGYVHAGTVQWLISVVHVYLQAAFGYC